MDHIFKALESDNQEERLVGELSEKPKANKVEITICRIISGVKEFWE